jgi:hypothetical protein
MNNATNSTSVVSESGFNKYTSLVVVGIWTLMTIFNMTLLILRRNYQPVKARFVPVVAFNQILVWIAIVITLTRLYVGRDIFPCMPYTFMWCAVAPVLFIPHIVRVFRLFFIFKLSYFKTTFLNSDSTSNGQKRIKIITRFISPPMIISVVTVLMLFHIALWLLVSGIISIKAPAFFLFTTGCSLLDITYLVIASCAVYVVIDFVLI